MEDEASLGSFAFLGRAVLEPSAEHVVDGQDMPAGEGEEQELAPPRYLAEGIALYERDELRQRPADGKGLAHLHPLHPLPHDDAVKDIYNSFQVR